MPEFQFSGTEALYRKIDSVLLQMKTLKRELPLEVANWRSENLGSKYPAPFTTQKRRILSIKQRIWNRGRGSARVSLKRRKRGYTRRPILREGLYDELKSRVMELVNKAVQW